MNIPIPELAEIMSEAFSEARSRDGARIRVRFEPAGEQDQLRICIYMFDASDSISGLQEWELPMPIEAQTPIERLRAFAEGYRRLSGALDRDAIYPEIFPCWPLLAVKTLQSPDDFAHVLGHPDQLRDALAAHWVESLGAERGLLPLPIEESRDLHALSLGMSSQQDFEEHLVALSRSQADVMPYLLALFESWADKIDTIGFDDWVAQDGGSLRTHLATLASRWLDDRASAEQAAHLSRLRERGLIKAPPPDYDALFNAAEHHSVPLEQIEMGTLDLPSGKVVAADPFLSEDSVPLDVPIDPGRHPVRLVLGQLPGLGRRVIAARLDLAPERAVSWQPAGHEFGVGAGLACFMSVEACAAFTQARKAFQAASPDGNYYDDVLASTLAPSGTPEQPSGSWGLHRIDADHVVAIFASGLGDGFYEVLAGADAQGRTVSLLIDFGVL